MASVDHGAVYGLSAQQRQQIAIGCPTSMTSRTRIALGEVVDPGRLAAAALRVRERQEILRSSFPVLPDFAEPVQQIHGSHEPVGLDVRIAEDDRTEVELAAPLPAVDAPSWVVIARELAYAYHHGSPPTPDEPVQYADYVAWQEDARRDACEPPVAAPEEAAADDARRRPALREPAADARETVKLAEAALPQDVVASLRALAQQLDLSERTVLLACWALFATAHAAAAPIVQSSDDRGAARACCAVGPYCEWLRFVAPSAAATFAEYARACERLACEAPSAAARTVTAADFSDAFAFEWVALDRDAPIVALGDCPAPASLRLRVVAGDRVVLELFGDRREWSVDARRLLIDRLIGVVPTLVRAPQSTLASIRWIGDADRDRIRQLGTSIESDACGDRPHARIAAIGRTQPDAPALVEADGGVITYGTLAARVAAVTESLRALGVRDGDRVALELDGADLIVGIVATWSASAAFVALPPGMPEARRAALKAVARPHARIRAGDCVERDASVADTAPPLHGIACIAFTSGSTGTPRAVTQSYAAVASYLAFVRQATSIGPGDVVLQLAAPDFDASMRDSIGPLTAAAAVVLLPRDGRFDALGAIAALDGRRVTAILSAVPSVLRALVQAAGTRHGGASTLRTIMCSGEPLYWDDVRRARAAFGPEIVVWNLYGPTECTMTTTAFAIRPGAEGHGSVPIGRPIAHARCFVLDGDLAPVSVGEPGDLYIGGLGVTPGYLDEPAATGARFIPEPAARAARMYRTGDIGRILPDGTLQYGGRADDQVKLRGRRVEPAEVAAVLAAHALVGEAVVLADRRGEEVMLRAFVAPSVHTLNRPRTPLGAPIAEMNDYETDFFYQRVFGDRADFACGISLRPGDSVFDVGANIGVFSLFVAEFCPDVRVLAFEPAPDVFQRLRSNTARLGAVTAHCQALGREAGRASLTYYPASSCQSGLCPNPEQERAILRTILERHMQSALGLAASSRTVADVAKLLYDRLTSQVVDCEVTTISDVLARERIQRVDLLKVDVEKGELDVLLGIAADDWPKIEQAIIEVHAVDGALERITSLLRERGFDVATRQEPVFAGTCVVAVHARRPNRERGPLPLPAPEVVAAQSAGLTAAALLDFLRVRLPAEAVPARVVIVPELPRNARGKIDRERLLATGDETSAAAPPADWIEEILADLWDEILGGGPYSRDDDFFQVGGHSLSAMRLAARMSNVFAVPLPLRDLFEQRTIAALAPAMRHYRSGARIEPGATPVTTAAAHPPLLALELAGPIDTHQLAAICGRVVDADALGADVVMLTGIDEPTAIATARAHSSSAASTRGRCVVAEALDRRLLVLSFPSESADLRALGALAARIVNAYELSAGMLRSIPAIDIGDRLTAPPLALSTWRADARLIENLDMFVQDYGLHRGLALLGGYAAYVSAVGHAWRMTLTVSLGRHERTHAGVDWRMVAVDATDDPTFVDYVERVRDVVLAAPCGHAPGAADGPRASYSSHALPPSLGSRQGIGVAVVSECEAFSEWCLALHRSRSGLQFTLAQAAMPVDGTRAAAIFRRFISEALQSPSARLSEIVAAADRVADGATTRSDREIP